MFKSCQNNVLTTFFKKYFMSILFRTFIFWIATFSLSLADEVKVFEFTNEELNGLEIRKVRGADNKTIYTVGSNENGNFLKAIADNAASGLGKEVKIDLNKTPFINITWKIERDLPGIKENTKGYEYAGSGSPSFTPHKPKQLFHQHARVGQQQHTVSDDSTITRSPHIDG